MFVALAKLDMTEPLADKSRVNSSGVFQQLDL